MQTDTTPNQDSNLWNNRETHNSISDFDLESLIKLALRIGDLTWGLEFWDASFGGSDGRGIDLGRNLAPVLEILKETLWYVTQNFGGDWEKQNPRN